MDSAPPISKYSWLIRLNQNPLLRIDIGIRHIVCAIASLIFCSAVQATGTASPGWKGFKISSAEASVAHDDNLSSAAFSGDRFGDNEFDLNLDASLAEYLNLTDWIFNFSSKLEYEKWEKYSGFDLASIALRTSAVRELGSSPSAPSLSANIEIGPLWARSTALGGWRGLADIHFYPTNNITLGFTRRF